MKKFLIATLAIGILLPISASADIQDPQLNRYGPNRKVGRALSIIVMGVTEIPTTMASYQRIEGNNAAWGPGLTDGTMRAVRRLGWGAFELVTFMWPTYKCGWRQPYDRMEINPKSGLEEFPPELGSSLGSTYNRRPNR